MVQYIVHSIPSYWGTLGPEGARISEMQSGKNVRSFLQIHVKPTFSIIFRLFFFFFFFGLISPLSLAILNRTTIWKLETTGLRYRNR